MDRARVKSWKDFCGKQDRESMWDSIYRVITRTKSQQDDLPIARDGKTTSLQESARIMAETFYPEDTEEGENDSHKAVRIRAAEANGENKHGACDPPFVEAELVHAVESFNPKKAPGRDGFTADICAAAIKTDLHTALAMYNKCLELSHFPRPWKEATIIMLRKPNKDDYTNPKSYRPIGLLAVLGKILEKMAVKRIKWHVLPKLNPRQYGFVPQRSTEDSLYDMVQRIRHNLQNKRIMALISLDIEGAFDNAWWPQIRAQLETKGCPINIRRLVDSYLQDRRVSVRYAGEEWGKPTNKGCVQGSIGGPLFWNILLDPLLCELADANVYSQAFADDIVLIIEGNSAHEVSQKANVALAVVSSWGKSNKLRFAPQKTKAMVMTNKLKFDTPRLIMAGEEIEIVKEMKILGLIVDDKLTFNPHISYICKKAINIYKGVARAAKTTWGLDPEVVRTIYVAVIEPIILYASSVWAKEAQKLMSKKIFGVVQRGFAQKIAKCYRTVSLNSALILSGLLPLDLRVQETSLLYEAKRGKPQEVLRGRKVEQRVSFMEADHPSSCRMIGFECVENAEEDGTTANGIVKIYTDGSKLEGKVGAALTCWEGQAEVLSRKFKLEPYCTVFQAELYAILQATECVMGKGWKEAAVLSDSRSALQSLADPESSHPITKAIQGNLAQIRDNGQTVTLFWIRAHVGVIGNERADQLAKEAALKLKSKSHYDCCPISYVKRHIRGETKAEWDRRYRSETTAATTKAFFPSGEDAFGVVRRMKIDRMSAQLLTGHGGFSAYLHRFKCKDTPGCVCDPIVEEDIFHVLLDCPLHDSDRHDTRTQLHTHLSKQNLWEIMKDNDQRNIFLEFALKIVDRVVLRNKT